MIIDVDISKTSAVGRMEQFGSLRETNQNIGLRRTTPANISTFLRHSPVKRRNPAALALQPGTQLFERRAVVVFQRMKGCHHLRRERGAGIASGLLDQSVQWPVHLLARSNGVEDPALGDFDRFIVVRVHLAGETRMCHWIAAIISAAKPAEELWQPVLAFHVYRHGKSPTVA